MTVDLAGGQTVVIALGGNAIARDGDDGSIAAQYRRAREAVGPIADLICSGMQVVLTHGNGPVIGHIVLRGEIASGEVPQMPLFIAGADSEGGIGLMLQQTLGNALRERGCPKVVATIVTQVVVDPGDPAFATPTKPIGSTYPASDAEQLVRQRGWRMAETPDGRFRRVVASPLPERIIEIDAIRAVTDSGLVAIAAGGGGVPVMESEDGTLVGVDAVIDKDRTSALLAAALDADGLVILMEASAVMDGWGTPDARRIDVLSVREAVAMAEKADAGSIAPKLSAAASFSEKTGRPAILCSADGLAAALVGRSGTVITGM